MPSPRNRTIRLSSREAKARLSRLPQNPVASLSSSIYHGSVEHALNVLPRDYFDLIIADPPYNYGVDFGNSSDRRSKSDYEDWTEQWLSQLPAVSSPHASFYICAGWEASGLYQSLIERTGLTIVNRITWKRDKGRGAKRNWKQNMEDIWFAVRDKRSYTFNLDLVKVRKQVIAPYRENGKPKDWTVDSDGAPYRMTHPSNIWTDLTVPFWSMPENTPHPTQKPEALTRRIILASSNPGDRVLDLFSGSGTTSVVAKRLGREFVGIEMNAEYVRYAMKRLGLVTVETKA
ncbi:MAG: DNA methyltransferase [Bacteroidota bacterium]|nr:DNA methyltransferase [Bacteroidota bacterium]MDP4233516.1 DNA methyltransferase [Bacteroidota bacterium]MDP4243393.1 DNA methyltransferase [Bacteroidota bacterium]MDP4287920.1 DNA methyltransferase [Bacteroidota bacterium]